MDREQGLVGIGEVAQLLCYSTSNIRRLDRLGQLRAAARVSGRRIWRIRDVEQFRDEMEKRRSVKPAA